MAIITQSKLRTFSRRFWTFLFGLVIALAIVVQVTRQTFLLVNDYRSEIEQVLSDQLGVVVQTGEIQARWQGLKMQLSLSDLRVLSKQNQEIFVAGSAQLELNLIDSLIRRAWSWREVLFSDLNANFVQVENYKWKLKGYDGGTANTDNPFNLDDPLDIFLFGRRVEIRSAHMMLEFLNGQSTELTVPKIRLENDPFFHRMNASLNIDGGEAVNFVVEGYGDPRETKDFSASGYLSVRAVSAYDLLSAVLGEDWLDDFGLSEDFAKFNMDFWFRGSPHYGMTSGGKLFITQDRLVPESDISEQVMLLESDIAGLLNLEKWQLSFVQPTVRLTQQNIELDDLHLAGSKKSVALRIEALELDALEALSKNLAGLLNTDKASQVVDIITQAKPQGRLNNIGLELRSAESGYFKFRAELEQGSVSNISGSPAFVGIDGYIESTMFEGYIDVQNTQPSSMGLPLLFAAPWSFDRIDGQVAWRLDLNNQTAFLKSTDTLFKQEGRTALGRFAMVLPFTLDAGDQTLDLAVNTDTLDVEDYSLFFPNTVPADIEAWLRRSLKAGTAKNISIVYKGAVSKAPEYAATYQVSTDFVDAEFKPDTRWPGISKARGHAVLDSDRVFGRISSATTLGSHINSAVFETRGDKDSGYVAAVHAEVSGPSSAGKAYLLHSPLADSLKTSIANTNIKGMYHSKVDFVVPYSLKPADFDYRVDVALDNNAVTVTNIDLDLNQVSGHIEYSKSAGLSGRDLRFRLWGEDFVAHGDSDHTDGDTIFEIAGDLNVAGFKRWVKRPEFVFFDGCTAVLGQLVIPGSANSRFEGLTLNLESDLVGASVDLPGTFSLATGDRLANKAHASLALSPDGERYRYMHGHQFYVDTLVKQDGTTSVNAAIGNQFNPRGVARAFEPNTIWVAGGVERANYEKWRATLDAYLAESDRLAAKLAPSDRANSENNLVVKGNMRFAGLDFFGPVFSDLNVDFERDAALAHWSFDLDSDQVSGTVTVPESDGVTFINLNTLDIALDREDSAKGDDNSVIDTEASAFANVDMSAFSSLKVKLDQLTVNGEDYGAWAFLLVPQNDGLMFDELEANVRGLQIGRDAPARFWWTKQEGQHRSRFAGTVHAKDIGSVFEAWDFERVMNSQSAGFDIDLAWQAEPDKVSLAGIEGKLALDIQRGSFLRGAKAGENPLLRLSALLNFDSLARRVRLDFSDLAAKGFAYDSISTELRFDRGVALIEEPLSVKSSSSKMKMTGELDLIKESIDADLVVTLPVAGNLVVATAFAAGLPAGLGVYLISKMFSKEVDRASSITYAVTGPWSQPKLKARRASRVKDLDLAADQGDDGIAEYE